jgi:hypothetical protein
MGETPSLPFAAAHALVVGIQDYGSGLRALETPAADARAISALLGEQHQFEVELLVEDVTRARLLEALGRLQRRVTAGDRALFYFAGHGHAFDDGHGLSGFLIPQDAALGSLDGYLPMRDVYQCARLAALPAPDGDPRLLLRRRLPLGRHARRRVAAAGPVPPALRAFTSSSRRRSSSPRRIPIRPPSTPGRSGRAARAPPTATRRSPPRCSPGCAAPPTPRSPARAPTAS